MRIGAVGRRGSRYVLRPEFFNTPTALNAFKRRLAQFRKAQKLAWISAPDWHGCSVDAFLDSIIYHDQINALKSPYTIRIVGVDKAKPEAQNAIRLLARLIDERGASDRSTDLEVTILVEDSN